MSDLIERLPENVKLQIKVVENPQWAADEVERLIAENGSIRHQISGYKKEHDRLTAIETAAQSYLDADGAETSEALEQALAATDTEEQL